MRGVVVWGQCQAGRCVLLQITGETAASGRASESSWSPQRWRSWSLWLLLGPEAALPAQEAGWLPFPCLPGQWPPKCSQSGLCSRTWPDLVTRKALLPEE